MNGFNIEQRKREAQQRLVQQTKALDAAKLALDVTREDLDALEQEARQGEALEPQEYVLKLTKKQALDAIHLLGMNITIPDALRFVDPKMSQGAHALLAMLQSPIREQFDARYK